MPSRSIAATGRQGRLRATLLACSLATAAAPAALAAQEVRILRAPGQDRRIEIVDDRPMIGVSTATESEKGDTAGLRIESVQAGSPAEKAGLKAGDRLQAVNGVSLRASRDDAGADDYDGVLARRLQRAIREAKAGEAVELRVLSGGSARTVQVTPVKASSLMQQELGPLGWRTDAADRAVLGLTITGTGSVRDTLGVFVQAVAPDGPAEKAGIVEGDRIAAINGVSLRVAREDAEDRAVGAARAERLQREVAKLKAGETAELTVVTAGRSRTVRVTAVKASALPGGGAEATFFRAPMPQLLRELPMRSREGGEVRIIRPEREGGEVRVIRPGPLERMRAPQRGTVTVRRTVTVDA